VQKNIPEFYNDLDKVYIKIWNLLNSGLKDRKWEKTPIVIAERHDCFLIPVFIKARNSWFFYLASYLSRQLRDISQLNELFNKKNKKIKIPHMGWNTVKVISKHPILKRKKFESYFVHSYNFICKNKKNIIATCDYQQKITAIVGKENIIGTQFHPEKSQKVGLEILKNFISWIY